MEDRIFDRMTEIPLYHEDVEAGGHPESVAALERDSVRRRLAHRRARVNVGGAATVLEEPCGAGVPRAIASAWRRSSREMVSTPSAGLAPRSWYTRRRRASARTED